MCVHARVRSRACAGWSTLWGWLPCVFEGVVCGGPAFCGDWCGRRRCLHHMCHRHACSDSMHCCTAMSRWATSHTVPEAYLHGLRKRDRTF